MDRCRGYANQCKYIADLDGCQAKPICEDQSADDRHYEKAKREEKHHRKEPPNGRDLAQGREDTVTVCFCFRSLRIARFP